MASPVDERLLQHAAPMRPIILGYFLGEAE